MFRIKKLSTNMKKSIYSRGTETEKFWIPVPLNDFKDFCIVLLKPNTKYNYLLKISAFF